MILGTISAVDNDNGLQLTIDGEDAPTTKKYTYMSSYVPAANDRVLIEEISGSYVIMGKVINDYTDSGIARQADTATNATNANHASSATTANSCSGNAATATVSDKTKGFDSSVDSEYGQIVKSVTRTFNATIGDYIVTNVELGPYSKQYFVYK